MWFFKQPCGIGMPTLTIIKIVLYRWVNWGSEVNWLTQGTKAIGQKATLEI